MSDAAFQNECSSVIDAALGGLAGSDDSRKSALTKSILEESKRIFRLCIHRKVPICEQSQNERLYCICCALATTQPHIWAAIQEQVTGCMKRQRGGPPTGTWRIQNIGDLVLKDVKRFIQVAVSSLKLTVADCAAATEAKGAQQQQKSGGGDEELNQTTSSKSTLTVRAFSRDEAAEIVAVAPTVLPTADRQKKSTTFVRTKRGKNQVNSAAENEEAPLDDLDEEPLGGEDDDGEASLTGGGCGGLLLNRDWNGIRERIVKYQTEHPSWRCRLASPANDEIFSALIGEPRLALPVANEAPGERCIICVEQAAATSSKSSRKEILLVSSESKGALYQCTQCGSSFHHKCIVPPRHDVLSPFACTACLTKQDPKSATMGLVVERRARE